MKSAIQIIIDPDKCIGCGACVDDCLYHVLEVQDGVARVLRDDCFQCGHCLAICPVNAVRMEGIADEIREKDETWTLDPDQLKTHLKLRRSIRQYRQAPVEREKLQEVIEAGRLTPSGSNLQNVRYIVIQQGIDALEDAIIAQYREEGGLDLSKYRLERGVLFHHAPALILAVSENSTNAFLAAMSMELMAESLGLGALYVGLFVRPANKNAAVRRSLGIAENENIAVCLALGYPAVTYLRSAPKNPANVVWR